MPRTTYENGVFELALESELPMHLAPKPKTKEGRALLELIARLRSEANVIVFRALDVGGGEFTTTVEHGGGTYSDRGQLIGGVENVTWPDAISDPYPIGQLAKLMEIRAALVEVLTPFHPTLLEFEYTV